MTGGGSDGSTCGGRFFYLEILLPILANKVSQAHSSPRPDRCSPFRLEQLQIADSCDLESWTVDYFEC